MGESAEAGDWLRAVLIESRVRNVNLNYWEQHCEKVPLAWITHAKSAFDHVSKDIGMPSGKRLGIERASLRELFKRSGETIHWFDTKQMLADLLTKDIGADADSYVYGRLEDEKWSVVRSAQAAKSKQRQRETRKKTT